MRKRWIAALGIFVLALAIGGWAEAAPVNTCVAGQHIVDTGPEAADIGANGYSNGACELIIQVTIPVTVTTLALTADKITIDPAGGPTPAVDVEIINNAVASEIFLSATTVPGGDIVINNGILKVHKLLRFNAAEDVIVRDSQLIAATVFGPPPSGLGGDFRITAGGNIDIQTTATHAGAIMEFIADGGITFICAGGGNGCQDPLLSSKAAELCDTVAPPGLGLEDFPCSVNFPTAASIRGVCFPVPPGVQCDGGSKEKRFLARNGDIDIHGTTLTSAKHITFTTENGNLLGAGANLTSTDDRIVFKIEGTIDLSGATLNALKDIRVASTTCPAAPAVCVDLSFSTVTAEDIVVVTPSNSGIIRLCGATHDDLGADFPTYNGDSTPPYNGTVLEDAVECAPDPAATIN